MYGYEILAELRGSTAGAIDLPEGTVYPALRRLERDGILAGHWVDPGTGGPRRRYYALTAKGEAAPGGGRADWHRFPHRGRDRPGHMSQAMEGASRDAETRLRGHAESVVEWASVPSR